MANEIYDSTWWGNTIDTASSIGTSTEMIQGQFNLTKLGDEEVTNGDFDTDSDWTLTQSAISEGSLQISTTDGSFSGARQFNTFTVGKNYLISLEISDIVGTIEVDVNSGSGYGQTFTSNGTHSFYLYATNTDIEVKRAFGAEQIISATIDNVSVKEVRAEEVEAVKCLADAIHRIGIQDIQN